MKIVLWGKVKKGEQRGRRLGFPTANFAIHKKIAQGIYISITKINNKHFQSLTFIGNAKTYNSDIIKAECFILDFTENIYDKWISILLVKKIRENQRFSSEEELVEQMGKDLAKAKSYFKDTLNQF